MEKLCAEICAEKASPRPHFNFGIIYQNSHCMQEILLKIRYFERGLRHVHKYQTQ